MKSQNTTEDTQPGPVWLSLLFLIYTTEKQRCAGKGAGPGLAGYGPDVAAGGSCPGLQLSSGIISRKRSAEEALHIQTLYSHFSSLPQLCCLPTTDGAGPSFTLEKPQHVPLRKHPLLFVRIQLSQFLKYTAAHGQNAILIKENNTQESCQLK